MSEMRLWKKGEFVDMIERPIERLEVSMPSRWYALRVHPNKEAKVMRTFHQRNISAYLPLVTRDEVATRHCRGFSYKFNRRVTAPLFSGLIFIPDFECGDDHVLRVDGVVGLLRFGDWTAYLTPKLYADVRAIEAGSNIPLSKRKRLYEIGQLVRVVDGPFAAFDGRIERLDSRGRLSVLVDVFKRMTPLELEEGQIEPVLASTDAGTARQRQQPRRSS